MGKGAVGVLQLYGIFCLGEMGGRLNVVGYSQGFNPRLGIEGAVF